MSLSESAPVLIAGAGPAGLVTAIGLARQGVRSIIIERHASTSIFPKATGVSTRSMEIFRGWGIDDEVRSGGWRVTPRQATVRTLGDPDPIESALGFPDEEACRRVSPACAAVSPQDHLEPLLVDHFRSLGMGEVRFSTELLAFEQDGEGVSALVRDGSTGEKSTIRCTYLVGADGHGSAVRAGVGIPMEGPEDLGQFMSILFRADLRPVLGETVFGLYVLTADGPHAGPPTIVVPSGADDRFVLAIPLPLGMDGATATADFTLDRAEAMIRAAAGVPDLEVEILAMSAFAFSAQVAARTRDARVFLVGDAAHRMTPRGGRGMNTAIADAFDLGWKLAWVSRGSADAGLLDSYEAERGPLGRRNVMLSIAPGGGGSEDGLAEDLGWIARSAVIVDDATPSTAPDGVFRPEARPGARAPHVWLSIGGERISTLDLFGRELVLLTAGSGARWRTAAARVTAEYGADLPISVHSVDHRMRDASGSFADAYGLEAGGAVLVRPDGVVAWRCRTAPEDHGRALAAAVAISLGRGTDADRALLALSAGAGDRAVAA